VLRMSKLNFSGCIKKESSSPNFRNSSFGKWGVQKTSRESQERSKATSLYYNDSELPTGLAMTPLDLIWQ